jgi:predicted metalloprotease
MEILVGQILERLEDCLAGGADESVERPDRLEQSFDGILGSKVNAWLALRVRHRNDLVACRKGLGEGPPDRAHRSDDDHLHGLLLP